MYHLKASNFVWDVKLKKIYFMLQYKKNKFVMNEMHTKYIIYYSLIFSDLQ